MALSFKPIAAAKGIAIAAGIGLACATVQPAQAADLVSNGGFETGDFTGWTQFGNTGFTGVSTTTANSGIYSAFLGPIGSPGFLQQTLSTVVGQAYEFSFALASDGRRPNGFQARIGFNPVFDQSNIAAQAFRTYRFNFTGTGTDSIQFAFQNDPGFLRLDDVSVRAIPTPALLPGLVGMGLAAMRKRKAKAETAA